MIKDQCNNCKKCGTSSCNNTIVYDSTPCQDYVKRLDLSKPNDSNAQSSPYQPSNQSRAQSNNGGVSNNSSTTAPNNNTSLLSGLFSFNGRIRRTRYWVIHFLVGLLYLPANLSNDISEGVAIFTLLIFIPAFWIQLANITKRFHVLGKSGWYTCLLFIPLVNIIFGIYAAFFKGEECDTQYGPNPY